MSYGKLLSGLVLSLLTSGAALAAPDWRELTFDPASDQQSCTVAAICDDWLTFRHANPWPYQTTAIRVDGDEAVIVLSEPPPTVPRADLREALTSLFGDKLLEAGYLRWPTGVDGWLEDIVIRVKLTGPDMQPVLSQKLEQWAAPRDVVAGMNTVQLLQFGTAASWFDRIAPREAMATIGEVKVTAAELRNWTSAGAGQWLPVGDPQVPVDWPTLARGGRAGAFRQQQGKLVALVLPKAAVPEAFAAEFRRFAIESDLLLGSVKAKNGAAVIVGRQRQIPMDVLPPIRFETFLSFNQAPSAELAQSYERKRIFAGKIKNGKLAGWDWAPILLSPQLQDGEMGTLLNIADQILKSWSEHGDVQYYSFVYPKPERYPFGDRRATDFFGDEFRTQSLRFNWNTEGFSTKLQAPEAEYLAVERTGALRLLYEPGDSALEALSDIGTTAEQREIERQLKAFRSAVRDSATIKAEEARDVFSGDPVLARVVQNLVLFYAVQNFASVGTGKPPTSRSDRVTLQLQTEARKWISELAATNWQALSSPTRAKVTDYLQRSGSTPLQLAEAIAAPESAHDKLLARAKDLERRAKLTDAVYNDRFETLAGQGTAAFNRGCAQAGGTVAPTGDRRTCKYPSVKGEPADRPEFAAYRNIVKQVESLNDKYDQSTSALATEADKIKRDLTNFNKALEVGEVLAKESPSASLDDILARVKVAGAAIGTDGSIRTPSVVLSRSVAKSDGDGDDNGPLPIGGHSLNLQSRTARISTGVSKPRAVVIGDAGGVELPVNQAGNAERLFTDPTGKLPPATVRTMDAALGEARSDSVLGAIRSLAKEPVGPARASVLRMLDDCGACDAAVKQMPDGSVTIARRGPPTKYDVVAGKGLVAESLSLPPMPRSTMFQGFEPASVGHMGKTLDIVGATRATRKGMFGRIGEIFVKSSAETPTSVMLVKRTGGGYEHLAVWGDAAALRRPVNWGHARSEAATPQAWAEVFPEAPLATDQPAIILHLGTTLADSGRLGIRVRPGVKNLFETVTQWLAGRGPQAVPLDESIIDLRAKIGPGVDVFLKNDVQTIRAASLPGSTERRGA